MPRRPLASLALIALLAAPAAAEEQLVDGIAAQVGTDIVLYSEVMGRVAPNERQLLEAGGSQREVMMLRAEGLEALIEEKLLEKVVRDLELYATDAEIDETIEAIASENGISVDQLKASVARNKMSYDDYRNEIKRELERRKVMGSMVSSAVHVEEEEIEALYKERFGDQPEGGNQVHIRQLLVPAGEEFGISVEDSCGQVRLIRSKIAAGESFEDMARKYSAAAPQHGGDIGWLHEDMVASWMTQLISPLEDGQVSDVMELPFGCTIVKLVERKVFEPISYEQARTQLHNETFDQQAADHYREWMEELRGRTFIERRGYFADAAILRSSSATGGVQGGSARP